MQNEMRDRLIDIVKNSSQYISDDNHLTERIADHLIAKGVIAPPCKVGDTVYVITTKIPCYACVSCTDFCHKECPYPDSGSWVVKTATVCSIEVGEICKICVEIEEGKVSYSYDCIYWFNDIGKTVFLTHEEAEQKLKEYTNNDYAE